MITLRWLLLATRSLVFYAVEVIEAMPRRRSALPGQQQCKHSRFSEAALEVGFSTTPLLEPYLVRVAIAHNYHNPHSNFVTTSTLILNGLVVTMQPSAL